MKTARLSQLPDEILVVGLARNVARRIESTINAIRRATDGFAIAHFLVIESDSDDDTVSRLGRLSEEIALFDYRSLGRLRDKIDIRTERLAFCRNRYLGELRDNPKYRNVSHLIVADLDGVCKDLKPSAIDSCWRQPESWGACTANQSDYYYDIWALRHPTWCPHDCWEDYRRWAPLVGDRSAREMFIFSRMIHLPQSQPMVEVDAAFGGLSIYDRNAIMSARYIGLTEAGTAICEHVPFCAQIKAAGHRIFVNPSLINAKRTRHASSKKFFRRFRRDLWSAVAGAYFPPQELAATA